MLAQRVHAAFESRFGQKPDLLVRAPGRINLIGEHTDYNDGLVFPGAVEQAICLALGRRRDSRYACHALDLNDFFLSESNRSSFQSRQPWVNYLLGTVAELQQASHAVAGFNVAFAGNIPWGAGMSSSAALGSGILFGLNELNHLKLSRMDLAHLAQRSENNFVGTQCGIMDMFASLMGQENQLLLLDCRDLTFEQIKFFSQDLELWLLDSGVRHSLVDSEYNRRREDCEAGVWALREMDSNISSLRDVRWEFLRSQEKRLPPTVFRRCAYVVQEMVRVEQASAALREQDFELLGQLMFQSHEGLNLLYEVCVPETNFLVEMARSDAGVLGARQMGGGFGGCTLNLVRRPEVNSFLETAARSYRQKFEKDLKTYPVRLSAGTSLM